MTEQGYRGEERRKAPSGLQEVFGAAVETAARQAAQEVARIHRLRLVRWTFLAALLTSLTVVLTIYFAFIAPQQRHVTRANSIYNCRLIEHLTGSLDDFVASNANLLQKQLNLSIEDQKVTGVFRKLFGRSELAKILREQHSIENQAVHYWKFKVEPEIQRVGNVNCSAHLSG